MRVVQVRVTRTDFADMLGAMRAWLDRNNRPLVRFETATEGGDILVNVQFDDDALAETFRQHFDGVDAG